MQKNEQNFLFLCQLQEIWMLQNQVMWLIKQQNCPKVFVELPQEILIILLWLKSFTRWEDLLCARWEAFVLN